jgi:hypothetical protein
LRQASDPCFRRKLGIHLRKLLLHKLFRPAEVDQAVPAHIAGFERNILGDAQLVEKRQVLMNEPDAGLKNIERTMPRG